MAETPFPPLSLAISTAGGGPPRAARIAEMTDATARMVWYEPDGPAERVATADLRPLTVDDLATLAPRDTAATKSVFVKAATAAFTAGVRITPYTSAATVALRALNLDIVPLPKMTQFVSDYAVHVAAGWDAAGASAVQCAIAEALITAAAHPPAIVEAMACFAWCAELCRNVGVQTASANYIGTAPAAEEHAQTTADNVERRDAPNRAL